MSPETRLIQSFFDAINREDIVALAPMLDPGVIRIEPEGFPAAGTLQGPEAVLQHIAKGRSTWAEGHCKPEGYFQTGDKVVVYLQVRVRLNGRDDWIEGRFADGFVVTGGRIAHFQTFATRPEALAWAGLTTSVPGTSVPAR